MLPTKAEDKMITIKGRVSIRPGNKPVIIVENIIPWQKVEVENNFDNKKIYLRFDTKDIDIYQKVKEIVSSYPGENQLIIKCTSTKNAFAFNLKVDLNNYLINELVGLLGETNVVVK